MREVTIAAEDVAFEATFISRENHRNILPVNLSGKKTKIENVASYKGAGKTM